MATHEAWPTTPLKEKTELLHPTTMPEIVHLDDPATDVMVNFEHVKPRTTSPDAPIDQALKSMKQHNLHMLIVVDEQQHVLGLVSSEDIMGEKPIQLINERRLPREKVLVKMVMTPYQDIIALDAGSLHHAKVGNIVSTLKKYHKHYILVIKASSDNQQQVCGLFAISQISKQLHLAIHELTDAQTIAELQKRISS